MYVIQAEIRYLTTAGGAGQETPIRSGSHAVCWLGEQGTSCIVTFCGWEQLAPGESCEGKITLPLGEASLPAPPQVDEICTVGRLRDAPVLRARVLACEQQKPIAQR